MLGLLFKNVLSLTQMKNERVILEGEQFSLTLQRLGYQLIEEYDDFSNTCIIGIQEGGVLLADRLCDFLLKNTSLTKIDYGKLDITFYRDDFRRGKTLKAHATQMNFLVENKRVILVDDVLYTGRSVQAAMSALQHYGRAASMELVALVDRRFNRHLPIQPDYTGILIDSLDDAYVRVEWAQEKGGEDKIILIN